MRPSWSRYWTAEGRDEQGRPRRDPASVSYNAAVESAASRDADPLPAAFAQRVHREAQQRGFDTADRRVVLSCTRLLWVHDKKVRFLPYGGY